MAFDYPITSFHFMVRFGLPDTSFADIAFQSVSGLDVQIETETIKEGGENRFEHTLPLRTKYSNLVLKRGMYVPLKSAVTDWCKAAFEQADYRPIDLEVMLLDEKHTTILTWMIHHAWPTSWKIGELNADKGEVLIETLELKYNYFRLKT